MPFQRQSGNGFVRTRAQLVVRIVIAQRHVRVAGLVRGPYQQTRALLDRHRVIPHAIVDEQWHGQRSAVFRRVEIRIRQPDMPRSQTGDAWNKPFDGIRRARVRQIVRRGERHLPSARHHGRRRENGEGDFRMLRGEHGRDPCAFGFCVQSGFARVHARPGPKDRQGFRIIACAGDVIAVEHGVVVETLVGNQRGDARGSHRAGDIAVGLGRFAGAGTMQEQARRMVVRRTDRLAHDGVHGDTAIELHRDMRFLGLVRALLRSGQRAAGGAVLRLDGRIGSGWHDVVGERPHLPFRRQRVAERAQHHEQRHRNHCGGRHGGHRPSYQCTHTRNHRTRSRLAQSCDCRLRAIRDLWMIDSWHVG